MNFNCYGLGNSTEEVLIPGGIYAVILKALPTTHATVPIYETLEIPGKTNIGDKRYSRFKRIFISIY